MSSLIISIKPNSDILIAKRKMRQEDVNRLAVKEGDKNREILRFYRRIAEKRGSKTARMVATRKLPMVCYSMLSNQRPYYNPLEYHSQA